MEEAAISLLAERQRRFEKNTSAAADADGHAWQPRATLQLEDWQAVHGG